MKFRGQGIHLWRDRRLVLILPILFEMAIRKRINWSRFHSFPPATLAK
jgi:hypothetical protein